MLAHEHGSQYSRISFKLSRGREKAKLGCMGEQGPFEAQKKHGECVMDKNC